VREQLLKEADEAIYDRRNSAIEQERAIKESELNTEIAVEIKKRQIRETQMDAERAVQEKKRLLREEEMAGKIILEEKNKELVQLTVENAKVEADAKAYSLSAVMDAFGKIDPKVINSLASQYGTKSVDGAVFPRGRKHLRKSGIEHFSRSVEELSKQSRQ
jgi:hypothetical protein